MSSIDGNANVTVAELVAHPNFYHARDSVGRPFPDVFTVEPRFEQEIRRPLGRSLYQPLGIRGGSNNCYRNAALTILLYSDHFMSYTRAHMNFEYTRSMAYQQNDWHVLRFVLWMYSRALQVGAPGGSSAGTTDLQIRQFNLNTIVALLWTLIGYPASNAYQTPAYRLSDKGSWQSATSSTFGTQGDAAECFSWLVDTIHAQLGHPTAGTLNSPQKRFDWVIGCQRVARIMCQKCNWRVQQ